jgi:hypothetical protein
MSLIYSLGSHLSLRGRFRKIRQLSKLSRNSKNRVVAVGSLVSSPKNPLLLRSFHLINQTKIKTILISQKRRLSNLSIL